jgi:4-hydroxythreonine-4-phosphate dehydrogenase
MVVGNPNVLRRAVSLLDLELEVVEVSAHEGRQSDAGTISCLPCGSDDAELVTPAKVDPRGGQAAYEAIVLAAELALSGDIDALVTAPLNKAALRAAGHQYPGHTELLAAKCGVDEAGMMLYLGPGRSVKGRVGLGVVHATLHIALRDAFSELTCERVLARARLADQVTRRFLRADGIDDGPRIGVCALNPHGGEQGLFGREELEIIEPAVEQGVGEGLQLEGPLPADTLLLRAARGYFDAIVAMYHDQGHIALKLLDMHRAVNITLGLPIIRTSVAHGTAFDLAWQGRAESAGLVEAVRVAAHLATHSSNDRCN